MSGVFCLVLQPAPNAYNMSEKVAEANRSLALVHVEADRERSNRSRSSSRRVTFRPELVTYGPHASMMSGGFKSGSSSQR